MLGHVERIRRRAGETAEPQGDERERVLRQQQLVWYVLAAVGVVEVWLAGCLVHLWR